MSLRPALLRMLGASVLFAAMATFVGLAHHRDPELPTLVASFVRSVVNLALLVIFYVRDPLALFGDRRPALWARGVLGAFSLLTYFGALATLGIGEVAFLNNTSTVWVAALAPFFLGERTHALTWLAVVGSLVGMGLLAQPRAEAELVPRLVALSSGLFAAGAYLTVRKAAATNGPAVIVFYFTLVSTLACGLVLAVEGTTWAVDPLVLGLLVGAGVCATLAQMLMTQAYAMGPAAPLAASSASGPLFTLLMGWAFLSQRPDARALGGMAILFVAGVLLPFLTPPTR